MLARLLAHPKVTRETVPVALKIYDQNRRPAAQAVAAASLESGRMLTLSSGPGFEDLTAEQSSTGTAVTLAQLEGLANRLDHNIDWQSATTVAGDNAVALEKLEEALAQA